jgi:Tfp pilus assembly protein PilN
MRAVNLLPRDVERARTHGGRAPLFVAAGGFAAVTAAAVVLFMSASGSIGDQQSQLDSLEAAIESVSTAGQPSVAPTAIAQERTNRVAALSAALTTRAPLDGLLRELAYVLPEDAWLTGLTAAAPAGATAGAPGAATTTPGVTIQGATYSLRSVARVLARLAALPSLERVRLTATARVVPDEGSKEKAKAKTRSVVTFSIAASLRTGAGA